MSCDSLTGVPPPLSGEVRLGTWNVSHWSAAKATLMATTIQASILAVQETHLAPLPLEWAHTTSHNLGLHLHHGRPAVPMAGSPHGRSCGVGFVAARGVALNPVLPSHSSWRLLHAMRRVHAVQIPPRLGLPRGMLLLSIYAPLQERHCAVERVRFVEAMLALVHSLDMQVPTLLMGDFNGALLPARDCHGSHSRPPCPLLQQLLGPGSAWVDVHVALLPSPLPWTFHSLGVSQSGASRIDLVLANHAAMSLIQSASVLSDVRDGGHSPVIISLRLPSSLPLKWQRPQPKLPQLLRQPSKVLSVSKEWAALVDTWMSSSVVQFALSPTQPHSVHSLARALISALQHLVSLAGGWQTRPTHHRPAYDSNAIRQLRRRLTLLYGFQRQLRSTSGPSLGSWPRTWLLHLQRLKHLGITFSATTTTALLSEVSVAAAAYRQELDKLIHQMRHERQARWKNTLVDAWRDRPGVIYHWLHAPRPQWGTSPILDEHGAQCMTPQDVDATVRSFWVEDVLRRHAMADEGAKWAAFLSSPFYQHIPRMQWPSHPWTGERARDALAQLRETSAPGRLGVPIAVWRCLPPPWMDALARLFTLVEDSGEWPAECLEAYVVMIPKSSGGCRPRDQRPITVLDLFYRIWSKGLVREWGPAVQRDLLGSAAMGFRAQTGTVHVVQLLSDIIGLRHRQRNPLFLASFDLEKCYDTIPWWALFGTLLTSGAPPQRVAALQFFYCHLRRCFRYGQVEGEWWKSANGLPQGCSLSPDLLNVLLEAYHRWARVTGAGVLVGSHLIPSISFADDLALVAGSLSDLSLLVTGYLDWCALLGLRVTKVQLWTNGPPCTISVAGMDVQSSTTFRMVGVVLGHNEALATRQHLAPRMAKAVTTAERLRALDVPASICSLLWRTTVLPQLVYVCEVRDIRPSQVATLSSLGKALLSAKAPLKLNVWRSPEVLCGLPLGDTALQDPLYEIRERQLRWLQLLVNLPGVVGDTHRHVAWQQEAWVEPTAALRTALASMRWSICRNTRSLQATQWPIVSPEPEYPGEIRLSPEDSFPLPDAVFTDGSLSSFGGAAAIQPDSSKVLRVHLPSACSSTHCELVALCLAMSLSPPQIITDSLVSLQLLKRWGRYSPARVLQCPERVIVRQVINMATLLQLPPVLEKVLAHNAAGVALGHPKSLGNDAADRAAAEAAAGQAVGSWSPDISLHGDAVELHDNSGTWVVDVRVTLRQQWWHDRVVAKAGSREWFQKLYPTAMFFSLAPLHWYLPPPHL